MQRLYAPGEVLGDRYTLKKSDWRTPVGPVWLARDRVLDRAVFVQVIDPSLADDAELRKAFLKTAAQVAQTNHPALLQVYDIGEDPAFVVFEHAAGGRLADRLRAGPLRPVDAARAALAVARGLEALHERGAWNGALGPETVLFDDEGRAKILALTAMDVARLLPAARDQPDGYRAEDLDELPADADRFALAALTYHMVTGRPPSTPLTPARQIRRDVPGDIDALLRRALDPTPANRPTMDEFEAALAPHARVLPPEARGQRVSRSEFRWLVPVVLIVIVAGLAATFGVRIVGDLADRQRGGGAEPTPTEAPGDAPLEVAEVEAFDPHGRQPERPQEAPNAVDGNPLTTWRTLDYAAAGMDKPGVGLLFDLGEPRDLARARVLSTLPGWTAEIRVADARGDRETDYERVGTFTAATEETEVDLRRGTRARYVLLWIVELTEHGGSSQWPFRAEVAEVELFAA